MASSLVPFLRGTGCLVSSAGAFYLLGNWRTAQFGPSLRLYSVGLLILVPFLAVVVVSLLGLRWRHALLSVAVWIVATLAAVEGFAQAQEAVFKRKYRALPPSADAVVEQRWWPFRHHVLLYSPELGEWRGNC